jgi:hypothetical protein
MTKMTTTLEPLGMEVKKRTKKHKSYLLHLQPVDVCYVHVRRGFHLAVGRLVIELDPQDTHIHKYIESVSLFSQL